MSECLTTAEIVRLATDTSSPAEKARLESHVTECAVCKQELHRLQHSWVRKNLRAALWIVLVGFICGGPAILGFAVGAIATLLKNVSISYDKFPSLDRPWLASVPTLGEVPVPVLFTLGFLAFVISGGMGLFIAWILRPRSAGGDTAVGLLTGLVAGVTCYTMSLGWAVTLAMTTVVSLPDLQLLADGYETREPAPVKDAAAKPKPHPQDVLIGKDKYPDLEKLPELERAKALFSKIVAENVVGSFNAIWIGMLMALVLFPISGICQTASAGYLIRRGDPWYQIILPYIELSIPTTWLAFALSSVVLPFVMQPMGLRLLQPLSLTAVAILGVTVRWPWLVRYSFYTGWFFASTRIVGQPPLPWYIDVIAYLVAGTILVRYFLLHKGEQPAAPPGPVTPPAPSASTAFQPREPDWLALQSPEPEPPPSPPVHDPTAIQPAPAEPAPSPPADHQPAPSKPAEPDATPSKPG
jgi:hypothetical protein